MKINPKQKTWPNLRVEFMPHVKGFPRFAVVSHGRMNDEGKLTLANITAMVEKSAPMRTHPQLVKAIYSEVNE